MFRQIRCFPNLSWLPCNVSQQHLQLNVQLISSEREDVEISLEIFCKDGHQISPGHFQIEGTNVHLFVNRGSS